MTGVRPGRPADARAIGRIEVETWRETYPGMLADRVLLGMSEESCAAFWTAVLRHGSGGVRVWEDEDGALLGFGHFGRQRDGRLAYAGEVFMLYVLPEAQGRGIGRALLRSLFAGLRQGGMNSALIWVLRANPSRFFYQRLGGRLVLEREMAIGGRPVEVLGYGWPDLAALLAGHQS